MSERHAVIQRLFTRAAEKSGGASGLARELRLPYFEMQQYINGDSMPPEAVLLRVVGLILEDLPEIRAEFPPEIWQSLSLPN